MSKLKVEWNMLKATMGYTKTFPLKILAVLSAVGHSVFILESQHWFSIVSPLFQCDTQCTEQCGSLERELVAGSSWEFGCYNYSCTGELCIKVRLPWSLEYQRWWCPNRVSSLQGKHSDVYVCRVDVLSPLMRSLQSGGLSSRTFA